MEPAVKFIGEIHSVLRRMEDCPLQESENAPEAEIMVFPEYLEGIKDLVGRPEILLLTWLHMADRTVIKCHPRRNKDAPELGVFSTRSPSRPNPVGVHYVKVLSVAENGLIRVSGLEAIDGTPVIDIKPVWEDDHII